MSQPKDLCKALKSLGLPNIVGAFVKKVLKHDDLATLETFKNFCSNLAEQLLTKLVNFPEN